MRQTVTRRRLLSAPLAFTSAALLDGLSPLGEIAVAQEPTPAGTPAPADGSRREAVLAVDYEALPVSPAAITLTRVSFPPRTRAAGEGGSGIRLLLVESQAITVVLSGRGEVGYRIAPGSGGGSANPPPLEQAQPDQEIALATGDGLYLSWSPQELRNDGERPASLLIAEVVPMPTWLNGVLPTPVAGAPTMPAAGAAPAPAADALPVRPFLTAGDVLVEPLAGGAAPLLPAGPGAVRLDRLALPAGWDEPLPTQPAPWLLLVESGQLGLATEVGTILYRSAAAVNPGTVPGRAKRIEPGSEVLLTAGGMAFVYPATTVAMRNRGRTTLAVLALAIVPARADLVAIPAREPESQTSIKAAVSLSAGRRVAVGRR